LTDGSTYSFYASSERGNVAGPTEYNANVYLYPDWMRDTQVAFQGPIKIDFFYFYYANCHPIKGGYSISPKYSAWQINDTENIVFYVRARNFYSQNITILGYSFLQIAGGSSKASYIINFYIINSTSTSKGIISYDDGKPTALKVNGEGKYWEGGPPAEILFSSDKPCGDKFVSIPGTVEDSLNSVFVVFFYKVSGQVYAQTIPFQGTYLG
jgi:hypothetical protein